MTPGHSKCLVKMETMKSVGGRHDRRHAPTGSDAPRRKALSLHQRTSKGFPNTRGAKPFTASHGWLRQDILRETTFTQLLVPYAVIIVPYYY